MQFNNKKKKSQRTGLKGGRLAGESAWVWARAEAAGALQVRASAGLGRAKASHWELKPAETRKQKEIFKLSTSETAEEIGRSAWLIITKADFTDLHRWSYDRTSSEIRKHPSQAGRIEKPPLLRCSDFIVLPWEKRLHTPCCSQSSAQHSSCVAFLFWRGSEKFPPHVLRRLNTQVSLPIQELPVMSSQWSSERSFQLCQELFHFVPKEEGETKSYKKLRC